jgi:hypothetical protein
MMQLVKVDTKMIVQFIVDGFEQQIYASTADDIRHVTFSGKKQKHTFTKLIIVTTNGWICKLSDSYAGSVSDLNLSRFPDANILEHLKEGCIIIGDKGFRGLLDLKIVTIDEINYDNESSFLEVRCTVENVIMKIRKWKIVDDRYRKPIKDFEEALQLHHKLICAICCLVNLFNTPLRFYGK